ncbi:MAG: DUF4845 domain-containing protein [Acidobacteria bacterium]|nr:DUF4845 domain-containing protein [Acidobacteriota bacterium]
MSMRRRAESGFLSLSAILALAFVAAIIFLAFRLLPPYINNYQLQDEVENLARTSTYSPVTESEIRSTIKARARELGIQLDDRQVAVRKGRGTVDIVIQYEIPVNLVARQVVLSFEASAGNKNIVMR